jgi:hypothetical protein
MAKSDELSQTYIRFLNLVSAVRKLPPVPALDAIEEKVLTGLGVAWAAGRQVTVLQAMDMPSDTSPTTVHRRLKSLRQKGLIRLQEDESDNRTKFVVPTELTRTYFAKLGQCVQAAAKS